MENKTILLQYEDLTYDKLTPGDAALVECARQATARSYAPYSKFRVGAAISLDNGEIVEGSNQENAAYPSGTCAERTACFYAHSCYPDARFRKIAIAARGTDGEFTTEPVAPCGACRQVMLEYEKLSGHPVEVLLVGRARIYRLHSVASLLPFAFTEF